jgi:tape measure domain-containing protein
MDTHGMKFVVDTSGVAKGFRDYRAAVDGIFKSLSQFEAHVDKTMKGVAKASSNPQALNAFKKSVQAFSKIDIDTGAAKKLSALSSAMVGFKAPSQAQSANAKKFFTTLGGIPDLTNAYRAVKSLSNLGATLSGFKAPSQSQSKNLAAFGAAGLKAAPGLNALGGIKNLSAAAAGITTISGAMKGLRAPSAGQIANVQALAHAMRQFNFKNLGGSGNFYAALGAIGAFRAPSQAQIRNLQQFVTAVGNMRVPPHATQVASALQQIATAASHAGSALGGLRAGLGGLGGSLGRVGSHAQGAKLQMMGLQNAFSGTFQIGSALRSLLGSLTIAELGRNFFEATNKVLQFKAQMGILSKTTGFADLQLQYIRETANRFGVSLESTMEGFGKVSIAANKAGMTVMQTRHVFEGFSSAMTVLGTSVAGQGDVWLALQQVMNKGYLSAEELNQQLNEKLPGAMAYATEYAEKMGTTLEKGLKEKALDASGVLEHIATRMKQDFGPAMADALMRPAAQFTILKNNITELFQEIGEGKAASGIANLLKAMASLFDPRDTSGFADSMGTAISDAANKAAQAINWLKANWDSLKGPISTALDLMGKWMVLSAGMQIGRALITPLIQLRGAFAMAGAAMTGIMGQQGAVARGFGTLTAGVRPLNSGLAGLGRVGVMLAGNFSLLSSTSRVASLGLVGLNGAANVARVGLAGLRAAGSAVAGFFGGPWGVALMAAATAVGYLVNQYYDMKAAFASTQPTLDAVNETMMSMGLRAIEGANNTKQLAREQELGKAKVDNFAGAVGGLAQNLYNAAVQARQMRRELLEANLTKLQGQREALTGGEGFFANLGRGAKEIMTWGGYSEQVLKDLKPIDAAIARQREELNALPKDAKGLEALVTPAMREIYGGTPTPRKPTPTEDKGGASKAAREALTLANSIDSLMKKLAESNDLWKLSQGYVADLTDEARALLTDGSFKQWSQNLQADFKAGKVSADSLIKTLEQPGAISQKALTEIKNRYGMDVQDIIQMLRAQQADYEDAVKDATIKQIDRQLVYLDRAMNRLSSNSPSLKLNIDFASDMQAGAKELLSKDQFVGFADTLRGLRAGTISAESATAEFNTRLLASADITKLTTDQINALTAANNRNLAALKYRQAQEVENATFGASKLRQMREENALLLLNERQQSIYSDVLEEVRTRLANGETVTQDQVQGYIRQAEALGGLNDQLQRNKEFFENNGIRSYLNDLKSVGEAANELDKNVLQSLEDQLFNLGTKGKFSFKAIFDTIQQGLIRASSQKITEGITKMFTSKEDRENGTASPMGKLFEMIGLGKYEPKQAAPLGSSATSPMYVKLIDGLNLTTGQQMAINPTTGLPNTPAVSGTDPASTIVNAVASLTGGTGAGTSTSTTGSSTPPPAVTEAATQTAQTFGSSLTSLMPAIGASFSGAFNGPIAGISQMFAQMLAQQMTGGTGGGMGSTLGAVGGMLGSTLGKAIGGKTGAAIGGALGTIAGTVGGAYLGGFKEGGIVGSPVTKSYATPSMFVNAPHYKEGTANTSGGIPAVLHDNEAVIPLSRGRKVPVDLGGAAKKGTQVNQVFNIQTPDANSFRKSDQQIASNMHAQAARAYRRNN